MTTRRGQAIPAVGLSVGIWALILAACTGPDSTGAADAAGSMADLSNPQADSRPTPPGVNNDGATAADTSREVASPVQLDGDASGSAETADDASDAVASPAASAIDGVPDALSTAERADAALAPRDATAAPETSADASEAHLLARDAHDTIFPAHDSSAADATAERGDDGGTEGGDATTIDDAAPRRDDDDVAAPEDRATRESTYSLIRSRGAACLACATDPQNGCAIPDADCEYFADLGAPSSEQARCYETLRCTLASACVTGEGNPFDLANGLACYCGPISASSCAAAPGNGRCRDVEERNLGSRVPGVVMTRFVDSETGAGMANSIAGCLALSCGASCFP